MRSAREEIIIRRLSPADIDEYRRIRLHGLRESPAAFGSSHREEARMPVATLAARLEQTRTGWTFGAFSDARLVGIVSLVRSDRSKRRHQASIYGMFVEPRFRRRGIGRALLTIALQTASRLGGVRQVTLSVIASNRPALRLYRDLGFTVYGREEEALHVAGRYHAELLLVRRIYRAKPVISL